MPNEVEEAKAVLLFALVWFGGWGAFTLLVACLDYHISWSEWGVWHHIFWLFGV